MKTIHALTKHTRPNPEYENPQQAHQEKYVYFGERRTDPM